MERCKGNGSRCYVDVCLWCGGQRFYIMATLTSMVMIVAVARERRSFTWSGSDFL